MRARILFSCVVIAGLAVPTVALATAKKSNPHASYALDKAKKCKVDFVKHTERHEVKGKSRRYIACVYVAPTAKAVAPSTPSITTTTVPGAIKSAAQSVVATSTGATRAAIDPSYIQNPNNPLDATFSYSASETDGGLPNGVLNLYWGPTIQSKTLACSMNVGSQLVGGTCEIVFPSYGKEYVTVEYVSGADSATQTDTEDIENPNPPVTTTTTIPPPTTTTTQPPVTLEDSTTISGVRDISVGGGQFQIVAHVSPEPSISNQGFDGGTVSFSDTNGSLCTASNGMSGDFSCVVTNPTGTVNDHTLTANFSGVTLGQGTQVITTFDPSTGTGSTLPGF